MKAEILQSQMAQGRLTDAGEFPKVVLIDTVSFCNLACSMCVHPEMTREKGVMSWKLFTKIIDEVADEDKNVRVWMVFFGEPFILKNRNPSIFDMIRYSKDKGLTDVVTNTNANLMDEDASRRLIESGLDAIYIGIDAFSPESYAKIRVKGDYEGTVKNIQYLLQLKEELKSDKPDVFVQFVEMDINAHEKEAFISFWSDKGAKVKIRPKVSWAGLIEAPNLVLGEEDRWPCYWAMQTMSITDQGKVVTCAVDLDARFVAGDVNNSTLKEVWNGKLKELRIIHQQNRFAELPEICRNCKDWQSARADYYSTAEPSK
ncbi:radical SAM protein [Trichlorobacter lovleyi]|uniref:radical SAM/SPASM domain-containing protein n=1 Tax=Trichlorobacter lovleyi TaxID=313985 RepID=UPI00223FAB79|nr:radical SAM protein [Trichlorobacter lovleyi]QOX80359.1 radical SAM protein [Trichlorobacter lovleyi]